MTITEHTSLVELATIISESLREAGINAVLSGGAAVSLYTANRYQSEDLDCVPSTDMSRLCEILEPLGFERAGDRRYLVHPRTGMVH